MSEFARAGYPGLWRTRASDMQCPRIEPCGYRCEAGSGGHDGPHLFAEHRHDRIPEGAVLVTEAEQLAVAMDEAYQPEMEMVDDAEFWRMFAVVIVAKLREAS